MRTVQVTFIGGALAAGMAFFLFGHAGHASSFWGQWAGAMVLGFGLMWTTVSIHALPLKLVVAGVALLETVVLSWLLQLSGIAWLPYTALAAGALATGFGLAYGQSRTGRRRRMVEEALAGRISRGTLQKFLASDASLPFAGEKREASVVCCQFFNRRELAGRLSAPDLVALSNAFSDAAAQALMDSGGVLVGGGGDQVRALFGMPLVDSTHSAQAHEAARMLEERLKTFCHACMVRWGVEPDCRVSAHSGTMVVGVFGSSGFDVVPTGE